MESNSKLISTINDVVRINNDRQDGYQLAARETEENNLKKLFSKFASDSAGFRDELARHVAIGGDQPPKDTTVSGKIHRAWMEVKQAVTGGNPHAILSSCEFGEDEALKAYDEALSSDELTSELRELLHHQRITIRAAHDQVKQLRDSSKKTN